MSISGIRAVSWYNPDDGTVLQANHIAEEGEFYTRPLEGEDRLPTGVPLYAGDESFAEFLVYDPDIIDGLEAWMRAGTRISMVAAGYQLNIQWYERDLVRVVRQIPLAAGRRTGALVRMERKGHGQHAIYGQVNLLAHLGWQDSDGDGLADGYGKGAGATTTFVGDEQRLEANGFLPVFANVVFPVSGATLVLSSEITQLHPEDGEASISIKSRSFDSTVLQDLGPVTSSLGRITQGITTVAGIYELRCEVVRPAGTTGLGTVACRYPALRTDGSDQYVPY